MRGGRGNDDDSLAYVLGDNPNPEGLYALDSGGNSTLVGTIPNRTAAMLDAGGNRFFTLDAAGFEYRLDPTTANETLVGNTGGQAWLDMTLANPVPQPSAFAALGLGGLALLRRRKRA